ncbi:prepilin-type N-terminal cleavage/methylation domain-containing protein [Aliivibrio fischeri]|uniref:pilin n=1 Tax=Aliivibrio fischeri TaxID=668 RepID=UPI0012D89DB4|nr:pilin [Aliivibrio fischeri]MUJ21301.1 prepilin-type N-terminal cleavage/methylation domain-containing protein [Aliivibrio fischeri]MUK36023.1 prepilin-type N-terminal cleavage/methylation domain-containing protein [Aliivibrio fischeri]MUL05628.1 prepilin-type N-terminal cleavage/methylation domain-containing protein [Aliivibrio fischeri]
MKKRQGQKGFTLIELMIVVAVIGVLSAIAIPKYQEFAKKGAVASGIATLSALKTNIEDHMATNGSFPTTSAAIGVINSSIGTVDLDSSVSAGIKLEFTDGAANGSFVALKRESSGEWGCSYYGTTVTELDIPGCEYTTAP